MSKHSVFISLTHLDTPIAKALRDLLKALFGEFFTVHFSTSKELEGGIKSGEDWFQWIVDRVMECEFALILITPSSLHKPWIPWEAGAVTGAGLASQREKLNRIRPLVYQVPIEAIPSPILNSNIQFRRGDDLADVKSMMQEILTTDHHPLPKDCIPRFGEVINEALEVYGKKVDAHLMDAPAVPTRVVLDEWLRRLDKLMAQNRSSEASQIHHWMDIAFGRSRDSWQPPLDLRIHSRLADLYLKAGQNEEAIDQIELARKLAPRDIYLLRTLGSAYLQRDDRGSAKEVIDRIQELDPKAFVRNAECAALLGRWHRTGANPEKAAGVYSAALDENPTSHYLANLLAEALLEAGRRKDATEAFRRSLRIIKKLDERNIWTHASAANAAFFVSDDALAADHLEAAVRLGLDASSIDSIERGLRSIAEYLDDSAKERVQRLVAKLET